MPSRDLVVVGGSAGAIEPLKIITRGLGGYPGTVLVVIHVPPTAKSALPDLLTRLGGLPARHAVDGEPLAPGTMLVAPPDYHMLVEDGHVVLTRGPRENGFRPAVDTLFRSAATANRARVVGVVLSGALDDGTIGLARIKAMGGLAVVQEPKEARFRGMPRSAVENVDVDVVSPAREIAPLLQALSATDVAGAEAILMNAMDTNRDNLTEEAELARRNGIDGNTATVLSCPECQGVLMRQSDTKVLHFQCQIGHAYSPLSLDREQHDHLEEHLNGAWRGLRERAILMHMMADLERTRSDPRRADAFLERARGFEEQARTMRDIAEKHLSPPGKLEAMMFGEKAEGDETEDVEARKASG